MDEGTTIQDAQAAVADAVISEGQREVEANREVVEAITESAERRVEQAEAAAQAVADAAILTTLGQQVESIRRDFSSWQENLQQLQEAVAAMQSQLSEMEKLTTAVAALELAAQTPAASSSLTPPILAESTQEVAQQILPESLESAVVESPVPEIPRKIKARWM